MSIAELGALGEFIGAFGVVASLAYLGLQVRQAKDANARDVAFELIRSFQTIEFTGVMQAMFNVPKGLTKAEFERRFEGRMGEVLAYFATWESVGILVHRRQIDIDLVGDFFSHPILHSYEVAQGYLREFRNEVGRDTPWEWFQWLAEQLAALEKNVTPVPAYVEFRAWTPN
jgi:hypothetical protein